MSGTQVSAWQTPNELLTSMETPALVQRNQLMNQEAQQTINANEMEQISRASNWVISQDPDNKDPAKQAAAYGAAVKLLRANNFAKNAPEQYPGFDAMQMMARQGTPSKDLYQQTQDSAWANANKIGGGGAPGATAPPADGGGGFSSDKETARRQVLQQETGGEANPATALNYVARADPTALARGATASGKYQFVNSTWREGLQLAGIDPSLYPMARDAPDKVQDQVFDAVYAKYGTKPWEKGPKDWVKDEQGRYQLTTVRPPPGSPGGAPVTAAAAPPGGGTTPPPYRVAQAGPLTTPPPAAAPGAAAPPPGPVTTIEPETGLPMLSAPPNALAPPPPPAAPPAAAPAATPPPAATAPPPPPATPQQPPFTRPAPINPATGLRSDQEQELNGLLPMASRSREGQAQWVARKQQMIQQNQADQRQYETQVNTWQNQQREAADSAERIRLSQVTSQREQEAAAAAAEQRRIENQRQQESAQRDTERLRLAQEANDRAGNDPTQHERILNDLAPKIKEGTATDAEQRRYAGAYYAIQQNGAQPTTMTGPGGVGTIPAMITKRVPASFPEPAGGALPLVMASPDAFKQDQMTVDQGKAGSFADRMVLSSPIMERLDDKALTWGQTVREKAGNFVGYNLNSPDYKQLRIAQEAFLSGVIRNESGAAVQQSEWDRYAHLYFPMPGDDTETIRLKRQFRQVTLESMRREAGPNYKPPDAATEAKPDSKGRPPLSSFQK